jgi:hypothetical protein
MFFENMYDSSRPNVYSFCIRYKTLQCFSYNYQCHMSWSFSRDIFLEGAQ